MKKKKAFCSIFLISFLYLSPLHLIAASADTLPVATSTSSTLMSSIPTPRSPGANSNLTLDLLPQRGVGWMGCTFASQRYCYEKVTKIDQYGNETDAAATVNTYCHNNNMGSTELCIFDGQDWLDMAVNPVNGAFTASDSQTTFHWKVRTGKYSPDIMMLGDTQRSIVSGSDIDGWVIEIWAKPALKAYLNGCFTPSSCPDTSVATSVSYNISGYVRMLGVEPDISKVRWPSVATESLRSALRGTFISTNGMSQQWTFAADTFSVNVISPHLLPADSSGKSAITPGYVRVFLPNSYIMNDRGYRDVSLVTADRVKLSVSGENAIAKVTKMDAGILVDTGVEHFSAPNPEMKILKATELVEAANSATTTSVSSSAGVAAPVLSVLKKGASRLLSSIARTKTSQRARWSASGACKISGSKLVASKKSGMCKVTLRVLNSKKKYVILKSETYTIS